MIRIILLSLFLLGSAALPAQTTVILVRHAEKAEGTDPSLTAVGKQRAAELARMLQDVPVSAIYATPYRRTRQTVLPLAGEKNLPIQEYSPIDTENFLSIVRNAGKKVLVFAGHSNTVPALVNALIGKKKYEELQENDYDKLFIVTLTTTEAEAIILHYGPPSPTQ